MNAWYGRDFIEIIETLKPVSLVATERLVFGFMEPLNLTQKKWSKFWHQAWRGDSSRIVG